MKSTSGRSIEPLSGAAPRGAPSGPSTNERLRQGPERPSVPGGPRWSPRGGGGPGTAPVRRGRHFTRGYEAAQEGVASLGLGLPQYAESLGAIATVNPRASPVRLRGVLSWVGTKSPKILEGRSAHDYLGVWPQLPPGKGKRHSEPRTPAFIAPWKPCPAKPEGTQGVFTPRLSSPPDLQAPTGSSP